MGMRYQQGSEVFTSYYVDSRDAYSRSLHRMASADALATGIVESAPSLDGVVKIILRDGEPYAIEHLPSIPTGYEIERRPLTDAEAALPTGYLWDPVGVPAICALG